MLNKVLYIGRITSDLEIRVTKNDKKYMFFDIAINDGYGEQKNTNYINCITWGSVRKMRIYNVNQY